MDSQQQHQLLPAKHVGSFLFLMFIATFRPTAIWPNFPISLEPIAVLVIALLLFYKIYATIGFKAFYQKYKVELLLLTAYFAVCFLSLYLNRFRYADTHEIIRYGITFIVITMSFPAAIFLFLLPQNKIGLSLSRFKVSGYLPWIYFALLALMAIWQYFDFESAKSVGQFFVSSEIWPIKNINSFFRISTDLGAVLAICIIVLFFVFYELVSVRLYKNQFFKFLVFVFIACLIAGVVSGSRVFLLLILFGFLCLVYQTVKRIPKLFVPSIILLIVVFHLLVFFTSYRAVEKLSIFLPYILPLRNGEVLFLSDVVPRISLDLFSDRLPIWNDAFSLIKESFLFGVSNGGFRFYWESTSQNTHSIVFQILIESGVFGVVVLFFLIMRIYGKTIKYHLNNSVFLLVFLALLFDYQLDHSLFWNVSIAFLLIYSLSRKPIILERFMGNVKIIKLYTYIFCLLVTFILSIVYFERSKERTQKGLQSGLVWFISYRDTKQLFLIDRSFRLGREYLSKVKLRNASLINEIKLPEQACLYSYGSHFFLEKGNSKKFTSNRNDFTKSGIIISSYTSFDLNCGGYTYPEFQNITHEDWISNIGVNLYEKANVAWQISKRKVRISSPIFQMTKGHYKLTLIGKKLKGNKSFVDIRMNDFKSESNNTAQVLSAQYENDKIEVLFNITKTSKYYLTISSSLDTNIEAKENSFVLYPKSFELVRL